MVYLELALMGFGAGALLFAYWSVSEGIQKRRQNKAIREHEPTGETDSLSGEVAIMGTITSDDPLPIGGGECVAAEVEVWQGELGDDNEFLADDTFTRPFAIETDSGRIPVNPEGIAVEPSDANSVTKQVAGNERPPEKVQRFDDWANLPEQPVKGKRDYEIDYIDVGDEVYLYGYAEQENGKTVLTDHSGAFFVTDENPNQLVENRTHVLKKSFAKGLGQAIVGLGSLGAGFIALFV